MDDFKRWYYDRYIMHHGIKGQQWGVKNGPPYPIDKLSKFKHTQKNIKLGSVPATQHKWYDDDNKPVAQFTLFDWWDGTNIENLKIYPKYRGNDYSYDVLDYAVKKCGAKNLSVRHDNNIAIHVYEKYGFKVTDRDDDYLYMSIK